MLQRLTAIGISFSIHPAYRIEDIEAYHPRINPGITVIAIDRSAFSTYRRVAILILIWATWRRQRADPLMFDTHTGVSCYAAI
jgi:hypothetical protein